MWKVCFYRVIPTVACRGSSRLNSYRHYLLAKLCDPRVKNRQINRTNLCCTLSISALLFLIETLILKSIPVRPALMFDRISWFVFGTFPKAWVWTEPWHLSWFWFGPTSCWLLALHWTRNLYRHFYGRLSQTCALVQMTGFVETFLHRKLFFFFFPCKYHDELLHHLLLKLF